MAKKILSVLVLAILSWCSSSHQVSAATYYVSPTGNDANNGSINAPFLTFNHSLDQITAGDTLILKNGTYTQQLLINGNNGTAAAPITIQAENSRQAKIDYYPNSEVSPVKIDSNYIIVEGLEVVRAKNYGIENRGQHNIIRNNLVHNAVNHGIYTDNVYTQIENNEVYLATLMNQPRTISSGWGSGIKIKMGGNNSTIKNNLVYHNYGEGIAVTRGANVEVSNNTVYDNYGVNVYIDNSYNVLVDSNFVYCTPNSGFERNSNPAAAFGMEEEFYEGWGAQLHDVTFQNNLAKNCYRGFYYWRSDVSGIGLENIKIIHNTLMNMTRYTMIIETTPNHTGNVIANNIFSQSNNDFGSLEATTGFSVHHNLFSSDPGADSLLKGTGDVYQSAGLAGTQNSPDAFKLVANSPAINKGAALGVAVDFWDTSRDSQPDIGAYEAGTAAASPTPTPTITPSPSPSPTPTASPTASLSPSPTPTPSCTLGNGDATGDGKVNLFDYTVFLSEYMKTLATYKADFNCDSKVNTLDYTVFLNNYHMI